MLPVVRILPIDRINSFTDDQRYALGSFRRITWNAPPAPEVVEGVGSISQGWISNRNARVSKPSQNNEVSYCGLGSSRLHKKDGWCGQLL